MLSFRLALLLSILGALLVFELLVWVVWRSVLRVFRRDLAPLRLLLLPALWAGDVLRISLGTADGDRDDGQRQLLERAVRTTEQTHQAAEGSRSTRTRPCSSPRLVGSTVPWRRLPARTTTSDVPSERA